MASEWVPMKPCEKGSHKSEDLKLGVSGVVFALLHFRMLRVSEQLPSPTPGMLLGLLLVWLLSCSISLCHGYFDNPLYPEMSNGTLHLYFMPANSEKSLGELENKFRQGQEHESHEKSHLNDDFLGMLVHGPFSRKCTKCKLFVLTVRSHGTHLSRLKTEYLKG